MTPHKDCLREAAHRLSEEARGKGEIARFGMEMAALWLQAEAGAAPPVPQDITRERAAIVKYIGHHMGATMGRLADAMHSVSSPLRGGADVERFVQSEMQRWSRAIAEGRHLENE